MSELKPEDVVIVDAVRTAIGRGHPEKGDFRDVHASKLLGTVYSEVINRAGIGPDRIDEVIAGCVQQFGEQMLNVGRTAWLQEGLPVETAGTTVRLKPCPRALSKPLRNSSPVPFSGNATTSMAPAWLNSPIAANTQSSSAGLKHA